MTRYTDDDLDRIEREAEDILEEAKGAMNQVDLLVKQIGLPEGETVSGFIQSLGPSKEMDELRAQHIGDLERELLEEEKRLSREMQQDAPVRRRRRHMSRV